MNKIFFFIRNRLQHYNETKYWKYRNIVVNKNNNVSIFIKIMMLYYIKRSDAFNNASMGTFLNHGAVFMERPVLPHGLYGIIISKNATIGKNCTIFHQVTIGEGNDGAPCIGDNCYIGAGAKIVGKVKIGYNVKIGVNCIVVDDIPSNSTVVMNKPRVIQKKGSK